MVNVIVPIDKNSKDYYKILNRLGHISTVNVHVGIIDSEFDSLLNNLEESDNVFIHSYQDGYNIEEMINSLQAYVGMGATVVMRKPITLEEFNRFITQRKDVVTCDREENKFKSFMRMLWNKILKLFLGVKMYEGDTSVIYLSEEVSAVISQSGNLSYSSRVDRWRGIEQCKVAAQGEPVKPIVDKKSNIKLMIYAIVSIVLAAVITTVVCLFAKMSTIIGLLIGCLDAIALIIAFIMYIMILFNSMVGKKHFARAIEIEKQQNEE